MDSSTFAHSMIDYHGDGGQICNFILVLLVLISHIFEFIGSFMLLLFHFQFYFDIIN